MVVMITTAGRCLLFWLFSNEGFCGQNHRCNGSCIGKSKTGYLDWVDNSKGDHVTVLFGKSIVTMTDWEILDLVDNN